MSLWEKPPKETRKTSEWARMTILEQTGGMGGGPFGPGSYELFCDLLAFPFKLTFRITRLLFRLCFVLIRRVSSHVA